METWFREMDKARPGLAPLLRKAAIIGGQLRTGRDRSVPVRLAWIAGCVGTVGRLGRVHHPPRFRAPIGHARSGTFSRDCACVIPAQAEMLFNSWMAAQSAPSRRDPQFAARMSGVAQAGSEPLDSRLRGKDGFFPSLPADRSPSQRPGAARAYTAPRMQWEKRGHPLP